MAPFTFHSGTLGYYLVFFLLGLAFGAVLELSGFGDSRKLSAQFYLKDLAVLKVMFTGIIVAAVLIHLASAFGLLDLQRVWVNPTYLVPGIAGGLIMGVGFIVGGFCPGTSLVAASTLKLDGMAFVLGGLFGVFAFGESVSRFNSWWHSTFMGRFTLSDWLHIPAGLAVALLVVMALGMFLLGGMAEARFGSSQARAPRFPGRAAAGVLLALCVVLIVKGQPSLAQRWSWLSGTAGKQLADREIIVDPREVVDLRRDLTISVHVLEVRDESDYNLFHLAGSERIDPSAADDPALIRRLAGRPDNDIIFLAANGEPAAAEAWKRLKAQGVFNVYVLEGGINHWLEVFPVSESVARPTGVPLPPPELASGSAIREGKPPVIREGNLPADEPMRYEFRLAVGERTPSAHPDLARAEYVPGAGGGMTAMAAQVTPESSAGGEGSTYVHRVKLQKKVAVKGGCG
jgi:rhodanese-related sulfurtransferase